MAGERRQEDPCYSRKNVFMVLYLSSEGKVGLLATPHRQGHFLLG